MRTKVELYKDSAGEWRWRIKGANGEIVGAATEGFADKKGCMGNLLLLRDLLEEGVFDWEEM